MNSPEVAPFPVVGVGAGVGGMDAFEEVLQHLPADVGSAFIFVNHVDPSHQDTVVKSLSKCTSMRVVEPKQDERVRPNHVYVIPPNARVRISNYRLQLIAHTAAAIEVPIDEFFRSLGGELGSRSIAVLLSGLGSDGTLGLRAVRAAGGITFAAAFDAMSHSASAAGHVDLVAPPALIAQEILRLSRHPFLTAPEGKGEGAAKQPIPLHLSEIFTMLQSHTGVDFSEYREETVRRRILRRMALSRSETEQQYLALMKSNQSELKVLFHDILFSETCFFREPATFEVLKRRVFPSILGRRFKVNPIRVWVPGCSTGEDAYSLAICLLEYMRENDLELPVQVFATDLNEAALESARAGIYPESIWSEVSADRLRRYFVRIDGQYQVARQVRDRCIFAPQNIASDPPFSRIDLILCRNILSSLRSAAQIKVLQFFHDALKPEGYLVLGLSESVAGPGDLFLPIDHRLKIFSRQVSSTRPNFVQESPRGSDPGRVTPKPPLSESGRVHPPLDRSLAGMLVDHELNIVRFQGQPSPYLEQGASAPGLNAIEALREELAVPFRKLLDRARRQRAAATGDLVSLSNTDRVRNVRLSVTPVNRPGQDEGFLVLFEELPTIAEPKPPAARQARPDTRGRLRQAEEELLATRQYIESIIQAHQATTEELKSANVEVQSSNEELQRANEELLIAKEELQSTNQELTTVNEEMQRRNAELSLFNNDLNNLLASVNIPIVMLSSDLCVRRFTPQAERILGFGPADIGRRLSDVKPKIDLTGLENLLRDVIESLQVRECEVQDQDGRWYSMWIRPYRTAENRIDGAVMALVDITDRKLAVESRYRRLFETSQDGILLANAENGAVIDLNPHLLKALAISRAGSVGLPYWELEIFRGTAIDARSLVELRENESLRQNLTLNPVGRETMDVEIAGNLYQEGDRQIIQFHIREMKRPEPVGRLQSLELQEGQSLEAVGRVAASLANDFGDLLTTIVGYTQLIGASPHLDEAAYSDLEKIRQAAFRTSRLSEQLLALGRLQPVQMEITSLNDLLRGMDRMIRQAMPPAIQVMTDLSPGLKPVNVDRGQLQEAVMSLVLNARDVMPAGGTVLISTRNFSVDEAYSREHPAVPPGEYVVLEVSDTRSGRERAGNQDLANPFEPFFAAGRNTGQGLRMFSVVRQQGGVVWAATELGRGGTCRIFLPQMDILLPGESEAAQTAGLARGSETLLLVEGDELLRGMTSRTLSQCGYRVLDAPDGAHALQSLQDSETPVALLLADIILPDMQGDALLERVSDVSPETRFLLMTGNPPLTGVHSRQPQRTWVIQKPFTPEALSQRIRAILDVA